MQAAQQTKSEAGKALMDAVTITAPGSCEMTALPRPGPGPGELLIAIEGCGLCASSIPVWEGRDWFNYPLEAGAPGHEGYGTVVSTGSGVIDFSPGDRVAALSYKAFAAYDIARQDQVVKIPPALNKLPFPGEPLGCAINIFERSDILPGQTVAIVGIGFLGALLVQLCKRAGAEVIAISRRPYSLEVAEKLGADHCIPLEETWKVTESVKKITGEYWCQRVIEATGKQSSIDIATEITGIRGKLIVAGFHQDGLRQVNLQTWNWRGIDVINAHERNPQMYIRGMKKAIAYTLENKWDYSSLITHTFSPDEMAQAFEMLKTRPAGFMKGIIKFKP